MCLVERRPQPVWYWESLVMLLWCTTVVCRLITLVGCTLLPDPEIVPFIFVIFMPSKTAFNVLFRVTTWSHPQILSSLIHLMKKSSRAEMQLTVTLNNKVELFVFKGDWLVDVAVCTGKTIFRWFLFSDEVDWLIKQLMKYYTVTTWQHKV